MTIMLDLAGVSQTLGGAKGGRIWLFQPHIGRWRNFTAFLAIRDAVSYRLFRM